MLSRQEIFTLAFTFVVGICFGVYLFFAGFMAEPASTLPVAEEAVSFEIIGDAYGGCRSDCPSFRVAEGGTYRYLYTPVIGEEQVIKSGSLPFSLQVELNRTLTPPALRIQSEPREPAFCNSYTDGVDVEYRITRAGETYILDTCGTAVETESALWQALVKIWNHFETVEG